MKQKVVEELFIFEQDGTTLYHIKEAVGYVSMLKMRIIFANPGHFTLFFLHNDLPIFPNLSMILIFLQTLALRQVVGALFSPSEASEALNIKILLSFYPHGTSYSMMFSRP